MSAQVITLVAWSSWLAQRQEILINHVARALITPKQKGTTEMRDEVLWGVAHKPWTQAGIRFLIWTISGFTAGL